MPANLKNSAVAAGLENMFSFQSQGRAMSKNVQTTTQLQLFTIDGFQIEKGVRQGYILSPCLFNLHAEYIMRNPGLDEAQAIIRIARKNISNLRYADDTTLMAES